MTHKKIYFKFPFLFNNYRCNSWSEVYIKLEDKYVGDVYIYETEGADLSIEQVSWSWSEE